MSRPAPAGANLFVWLLLSPLILTFWMLYICLWLVGACMFVMVVLPLNLLAGKKTPPFIGEGGGCMKDREY